jgi:hypothetical protein
MIRRPDLLDHLAPLARRRVAEPLACLAWAAVVAAAVVRLAATAPITP